MPAIKKARDEATATIDSQVQDKKRRLDDQHCRLDEQKRKIQEEHDSTIATLENKREAVSKSNSVEEVEELMSITPIGARRKVSSAFPALSAEDQLELKHTVSDPDSTDQVLSAQAMTGTKRKIDGLLSETRLPSESTIGGI